MAKSVLGSGLIAVDHIFLAKNKGHSIEDTEYLGSAGGGTVSNVLCLLSLLGFKSHVFGVVGNDIGANIVKEDYRLFGIDYKNVVTRGDLKDLRFTRQYSHIIFQDGTHKFKKTCLECSSKFEREYQITEADVSKNVKELAKETDLIILDRSNKASLTLAQIAKKNGKKIVYDLSFKSYGNYLKTTEEILQICDLVKINKKTFKEFMGSTDNSAIMAWRAKYPRIDYLLITDGENGVSGYARISNQKPIFQFESIHCGHTRDPGGAGDVFLGIAISQLLFKESPNSLEDFKKRIDLSQALASLNCTLYGARALQRTFLNQGISKEEVISTAEFITQNKETKNSFSPKIGLPNPKTIPYRLAKLNGCKICGSVSKEKREKMRSSTSKTRIKKSRVHQSLTRAPWTMLSSFRSGKMYRELVQEICSTNSLIIGSGGSFTASVFAETMYLHELGKIAKAITPYEFEGLQKIDEETLVWFISHGGGNTDILGSALHAKKLNHKNCVILTGNKNSKLSDMAKENGWKSIFVQAQERNFVSVIGLLSQVSIYCGLLSPENSLDDLEEFFSEENLRTRFNSIMREMRIIANKVAKNSDTLENVHLVGFARGWGWPALIDLESKIVEGGVCTIEISELKNFTHGRYMNLFGRPNRRVILYKTPKDGEIVDYLVKKFHRFVPSFIINTDNEGIVGALDLLIKSLFLSWYLGEIAKKDILKPRFPMQARGLYSWEPSYRKGFWKNK